MTESMDSRPELSLLDPVDDEVFNNDYREFRPLHISRSDQAYFSNVVSTENLASVFATAALYYPDVQLTQSGHDIMASDYASPDGLIDPARFFARYVSGATVIVSGSDRLFPEVAALCRQASQRFGGACRANLYLSPPGHQGFAPHYDTHDVLVLQISGSKTFRLYANNVSLPFPEDSFQAQGFEPGDVIETIELTAGDTFYIPRGFTHDACASEDSEQPSLHLTLGLYPPLLRDVLHRIVGGLVDTEIDLRRSINKHDWQYDGVSNELLNRITQHLNEDNLKRLLPQVMREFRDDAALAGLSTSHQATSLFANTAPLTTGNTNANLILQKSRYLGHETLGDILYCRTFGQVLEFRSAHRHRVEAWLDSGTVPVSHFVGSVESPLDSGEEVLKSLVDCGLGLLQPA